MKVISALLDENFRVYGVLALDYECIWIKSWKLKLVGLDEMFDWGIKWRLGDLFDVDGRGFRFMDQ